MFVAFLILTQFSLISLIIYLILYIVHILIGLTIPLIKLLNFTYNKKKTLLNSISNLIIMNKPLTYLLAINFFSLAGLPPLGGFFAKFYIFIALFETNSFTMIWLFIIISCFSAFYYIKIIQLLLFFPNTKPTFIKILPFSYCLTLTSLSYIILFFIILNHILLEISIFEIPNLLYINIT